MQFQSSSSKQYSISNVSVSFPYEAYECQLKFMEFVILALQNVSNNYFAFILKEHALLESPTGTGKTLCLLCAVLGWKTGLLAKRQIMHLSYGLNPGINEDQNSQNTTVKNVSLAVGEESERDIRIVPQIIYASRTHSQLAQVIAELKKTSYNAKICVLSSREQTCVHPLVKSITNNSVQNSICRNKIGKKTCEYHANVSSAYKKLGDDFIMDIEEMVNYATIHKACPYYLSRENLAKADILFVPYNYLLDAKTRKSQGIDLKNSIVIIDEAHNLEGSCGEATSFDLSLFILKECKREVGELLSIASNPSVNKGSFGKEYYEFLEKFIGEMILKIDSIQIPSHTNYVIFSGDFIFKLMESLQLDDRNISGIIDLLDEAIDLCKLSTSVCNLNILSNCLRIIFKEEYNMDPSIKDLYYKYYRVYIKRSSENIRFPNDKSLSYWCFNPGVVMRDLVSICGVRNVILASGTLSPLKSFAYDLQIPFKYQLENLHVIDKSQIFVGVLSNGPSHAPLNSSFAQRSSITYKEELGHSIAAVAKQISGGILVFFPSYFLLEDVTGHWKNQNNGNIWKLLEKEKKLFAEPKERNLFVKIIGEYNKECSIGGAILFAVCRGKASEGVDFSDDKARCVIITGIPFPAIKDPKIELKKKYLDELRGSLTGNDWYVQQGARAVNQAIGRVIRHRRDYGAVLLFDNRFSHSQNISQLSFWLRNHINIYEDFSTALKSLNMFFVHNKKQFHSAIEPKDQRKEGHIWKTGLAPMINPAYQYHNVEKLTNSSLPHHNSSHNITNPINDSIPPIISGDRNLISNPQKLQKRSLLESLKESNGHSVAEFQTQSSLSNSITADPLKLNSFVNLFSNRFKSIQELPCSTQMPKRQSLSLLPRQERTTKSKEYVQLVKNTLTPQQYKIFETVFVKFTASNANPAVNTSIITDIQTTSSIENLLREIAQFLHSIEKFSLFEDFEMFVSDKYHNIYLQLKLQFSI